MVAISSVTPIVNTASAALDSKITINFDTALDPATIILGNVTVIGSLSGTISGSLSLNNSNKTIVFAPTDNFRVGEEITLTISPKIQDTSGNSVALSIQKFRAGVNFQSTGSLTNTGQILGDASKGNEFSNDVALGDFNGDGYLDAFVANAFYGGFSPAPNKIYLNDGSGNFTQSQTIGSGFGSEVSVGDLDGDGDLDAVVSNVFSAPDSVFLNDGSGNFSLTQSLNTIGTDNYSSGVELGDVDGDGDLDAFITLTRNPNLASAFTPTPNFFPGSPQPNAVWLNDGKGYFTDSGQRLGASDSYGVKMADLDGDGDLDAFVTNTNDQADQVYFNNGQGIFTDSGQQLGSGSRSGNFELGDVDGDGDLDAVVATLPPFSLGGQTPKPNIVWLNDGKGIFTQGSTFGGGRASNSVTLGDIDGDGDLDAFVGNFYAPNELYYNDGVGNFTSSGIDFGGVESTANAALGDFNGDGTLDIFMANTFGKSQTDPEFQLQFGANQVWLNTLGSKPEATLNPSTNVVSVSKSTNLKFKLTKINTSVVNEVGFFVVRDNNGTITDSNGQSLTPADAGYTAAAMQQATVLFSALGNSPSGFDPLSLDRIIGALGGTADVFAGGAKLVFYFLEEGSTDGLVAGKSGNVLFGTTFESSAFGASANLTITDLGGGKFSLSWLDNLTLTLESTDDDLPFGSSLQGQNECEILDLTGLSGSINISVNVYREAAFDNLVGFYVIDDIEGTVAGVSVGASNYVQTALNNRISTLDLLSVSNGSQATFTGVLGAGQYLAPFIVVDGTLDDALAGNAEVYFPFLGSNSDGADHVRLLSNNVFGFEDLAGGGDNDFQDLIIQIQAA